VANLLGMLREAGGGEQAAALTARAAAHASLDGPGGVANLLGMLREAGAGEQTAALTARLPAAGMFELFLQQDGHTDRTNTAPARVSVRGSPSETTSGARARATCQR
jgi:hypothetical protein